MNQTEKEAELEIEFYSWVTQHGKEEAIRIAADEWGKSEIGVRLLVNKWEDGLTWL